MSSTKPAIDWAPLQKFPPNEIECRCGAVFRSLSKSVAHEGRFATFTQSACPACGRDDDARRVSSPPEEWTIHR